MRWTLEEDTWLPALPKQGLTGVSVAPGQKVAAARGGEDGRRLSMLRSFIPSRALADRGAT